VTNARGPCSAIGLAVAAAIAGMSAPSAPSLAADADNSSTGRLEEVIVTARKRTENLQDVPLSIDVLSKKDMQNLDITGIDDYAEKQPSISFISEGPGAQFLVMRGVSDGSNPNYANTSATGFFVDDMSMSWQGVQPDLHLYDIERIEVLNGPQGTTFGASSMSGAIRYVTSKPDLNAFSAGVDLDGGTIKGGQQNWTSEGFLNLPIISGKLGPSAAPMSASSITC
jgi:outer membrane receptor protein involved in Fe transport